MRIGIVLIILGVVLAWAEEREDQKGWLVVGKECGTKVDVSKVELWFPVVEGEMDRKHVEVRGIMVTSYDSHCGVYRIERVNRK